MEYGFKKYTPAQVLTGHLKLGGSNPAGERIDVNSSYFTRGEKPWIPVMGEFHFSRYNREKWPVELRKMKAGGITTVSTYLLWIYHEETEGEFDFTGDNDIRAFVEECESAGLEVVLRIGPWAHGECRNGGFPDWLLQKPFPLRCNNEDYLKLVRIWYGRIAEEVKGLFYKDGGCIVAVQLENEFVNDAKHLAKLKELAIECGMEAPIFTVTGWNSANGARIPVDEVVPVFGGYPEAPWENHQNALAPSVHYFFNRMRNDSAIGADQIASRAADGWQLPYERYPFATCELGGGIEVTHHRRPIIRPMDIYALSLVKLGDGNNLPGYYMYHGGTNKLGKYSTFQESKATGYSNDYPILSYDFQTALSEYGEARDQYGMLNMLHMFLREYQEKFAPMGAVDALQEVDKDDTDSLRYGMRTDGKSGFVFVNHYQRLTKLSDVKGAVLKALDVTFPAIDVCGEVSFFMPFHMELCEKVFLRYATAQPLTRKDNTWFFLEIPGIPARYQFERKAENGAWEETESYTVKAGLDSGFAQEGIRIVTLTWDQARFLRKLKGEIYIGDHCNLYEGEEGLLPVEEGCFKAWQWKDAHFKSFETGHLYEAPTVREELVEEAPFVPEYVEELCIGGARRLTFKKLTVTGEEGFVVIEDACDVSQIYANGELIADNYYYGKPWRVPAALLSGKECYLVMSEMKDDFYREF